MQPPARRTSGSGTRSVRIRTRHPCTKRHGRSRNASPSESSAGRCPMRCSARRNIRPAPGPTGRAKPDSQKSRAAARESSAEKHPVQHIRQLEDCQNKNAKKIRAGQQMAPCQTAASREKSVCHMHIGSLLRMRAHPGKTAEAPGKRPERHGKGASPPKRAGQTSCHPAARLSKKRQANRKRASERIPVQCGCHACPSALVSAAVQLGSAESRSAAPAGLSEVPAASRQKPPPPMHFQRVRIPAELYRSEKPKRRKRPT